MGKMKKNYPQYEGNTQQTKNMKERELSQLPTTWGMEGMNAWRNGQQFWAFTWLISQNTFFQKWVLCPIRNWPPYLAHPHVITNSTTSSRKKMIWGKIQEMGSWQFWWVLPLTFGFSPLNQRFESPPPPPLSLGNHAPISLMLHWHSWLWVF